MGECIYAKKLASCFASSWLLAYLFQCFFAVKFYLPEFWIWFGQFLFGFLNFSEEGLAFGASSSVFCCCPGNGLSFEYVGLRTVGGSVGIPTVLASVPFLGKKPEV